MGKKVLKPKTKLPSCPYLQPQPINEKSWIEERAEAEYVRKILRDQKFREEMSTREKYKKEMDLKEREKKFQEKVRDYSLIFLSLNRNLFLRNIQLSLYGVTAISTFSEKIVFAENNALYFVGSDK